MEKTNIKRKMKTRLVSSMEKVFPEKELEAAPFEGCEFLQGERAHFQLAYQWKGFPAWAECEVVSPLTGVTVCTVELEPAEYVWPPEGDENFIRKEPGLFPDILAPADGAFRLYPDQWRSLWIDVDTSDEAAGVYPVTIRIRAKASLLDSGSELVSEDTFRLNILNAKLPEQKLIYTQWFHGDCIAQQYQTEVFSEKWWALVEKYMKFAAEHGMNMILTPLFTPPLDTLPGSERLTVQLVDVKRTGEGWQFGYDRLERWIDMAQGCGIYWFEASHMFTQWGAKHAPKILADTENGREKIFGWETDAAGEEYIGFLEAFLPDLTAFFEKKGVKDRVYFHISDEPTEEHLEQYEKLSAIIHRLTPGFLKMDAISDYSFYERGLTDIPVCATNHIAPFLAHETPHLWAYYCCAQSDGVSNRFLGMPGARNRCIGLQLYENNIEGFLQWGHNFWMTQLSTKAIDPYRVSDAGGAFPAGDAFSVYPGAQGPVSSVRMEVFLEALQDLRALELAEERCGREAVRKLYRDIEWSTFGASASCAGEVLDLRSRVNAMIAGSLK